MVDGKYMAKAYANAATKETFEAQCLRDENGEIMTKTAKVKVQMFIAFTIIEAFIILVGGICLFEDPEELRKMGNDGIIYVIGLGLLVLFYIFILMWFGLRKYKKYYLKEEGVMEKRGFSERLIRYVELSSHLTQWKPLIYHGKLYFVTKQGLISVEFSEMTSGVSFCLLLLKILGEETIMPKDFENMYQPGHWREKRAAKKELKKRKQYVKGNQK